MQNSWTNKLTSTLLTPLGLALLSGTAVAQQSVVEHCKQTSSDSDRIACLEAALLGKAIPVEPPNEPAAAAATAEAAAPEEVVAPAAVSAAPEQQAAQVDPPSMELEAGPADDTIEPAPAAAVATAEAPPEEDAQPTGIGAEQVIAQNQTKEEQQESRDKAEGMVITKYEWVPYERMVVYFENGQVWRQIKGDRNRIRTSLERNQTANITKSGLSGYQLRLNEIRRTIRVERIR